MMHEDLTSLAAATLYDIAHALERASLLGIRPTLKYGILMTDIGYVIPEDDGTWWVKLKVDHEPYAYVPCKDRDDFDD